MNRKNLMIIATVSVVMVSSICFARITALDLLFEQETAKMKAETGTYDQDFVNMVDRLEGELAERASFPYLGGKDPMTGKTRILVARMDPARNGRKNGKKAPGKQQELVLASAIPQLDEAPRQDEPVQVAEPVQEKDPVRLTAIIYDDFKKAYTAIMMVGERSYSIEVGDRLHGRITREISVQKVTLEDANRTYLYDISGNISNRAK